MDPCNPTPKADITVVMNNSRYQVVPQSTYLRAGAVAGLGSALILLVNAAKRGGVLPTNDLTQLVAPLAQIFALAFITALYLLVRRTAGMPAFVAYLVNAFSLAMLVGVEFVINLVFAQVPPATIGELRAGPLGIALTVASMVFLLGTLAFSWFVIKSRVVPVWSIAVYTLGAVLVALRAFVPPVALLGGLIAMAVGIAVASIALWRAEPAEQPA